MQTEWIALSEIEIGERRRPLDMAHVQRLASSIEEIGLKTPITVMARKDADGWRSILVSGHHRLEALRLRGEEGAECFVLPDDEDIAQLWEIDENLARAELTPLQRSEHHFRREEILKRKGLVLSGAGKPSNSAKSAELTSYAKRAAAELGVSERSVRQDLRRAKEIDPEVRADIAGTELDTGAFADILAATPRDKQRELVEQRRSQIKLAPDPLNDPEAHEKQLAALMSAWNRAAAVVREEFLLRIADRPVFESTSAGKRA